MKTFTPDLKQVKLLKDVIWEDDGPQLHVSAGTVCQVLSVEAEDHAIVKSPDG